MQKEKTRILKIEKDYLDFFYGEDGKIRKEISLHAGWHYISTQYFKEELITSSDIERAANYIEDEFMLDKELISNNEKLVCTSALLASMFDVDTNKVFKKSEVEVLFDEYVDCATGEPAIFLHLEFTKEKFITILLLREVMYYLKFDEIEIGR